MSCFMKDSESKYGERWLQTADLHTPWYLSFRCMLLREKELQRNDMKLGVVKSSECRTVTVAPNSKVVISGYIDKSIDYPVTSALLQATEGSVIPTDLDISPSIVMYPGKVGGQVDVHISNITTRTVNIPPKGLLCELHPVTVESEVQSSSSDENKAPCLQEVHINTTGLSLDETKQLEDLIEKYSDIFSTGETDIGHSTSVHHRIDLTDDIPFKQRHRRIPPAMYEEVRDHLKDLLSCGIIRRSHSPWSSPVVLARKKDGKLRMCIDYRALNQRTIKDSYALPRIEEILDSMSGSRYFSVLDMKSGYHQVELEEEHKSRTAFTVGPLGFWEFNRLPFGLVNAPATYQRLMEECLGDLHLKICFIYLDDLIIFAKTYEEHIERLELVFQRLRQCGLKLSPKKCHFLQEKVTYVGHVVSADGIEADPSKIDKVVNWPTPTSPEAVRQFLGFCGYYRRFIKDFATIARPLTDLMPTPEKKKRGKKRVEPQSWHWGSEQDAAFTEMKNRLASPPVLAYPDFTKPFELHTDASMKGLGAVLYQEQDGQKRAISFASRGLSKTEKHYPAHKMEFLALKWAVTEKYHDYLYGQNFTVITDNNPLTYVLTSAKLDATGHRWLAALSSYNFEILYRPGKANADADALSRHPSLDSMTLSSESVHAVCHAIHAPPLIESISMSRDVQTDCELLGENLTAYSTRDLRDAQNRDRVLGPWMKAMRTGKRPSKEELLNSPDHVALQRTYSHLTLVRGVLYRQTEVEGQTRRQLVIPHIYVRQILQNLHNNMGHPGRDRTLTLVRDRFYWPGMAADVGEWVGSCGRCLRRKSAPELAPLVNISTTFPLELVCMDFLTLDRSKGGFEHVLVITDHFTRYAQAYATRNMTAKTTADVFFNQFVVHYGWPKRIHSDQGANFESNVLRELCNIAGIEKSRTTPYHPMGNGQCERMNQSLISMLGTLDPSQKSDWKSYLAPMVHAYNCTRHESTKQSPYYLMFGREPRLPVDIMFGLDTDTTGASSPSKYVKDLKQRLQQSYELASTAVNTGQSRRKKGYDIRARAAQLEPNDRVLVRILAFEGRHKLSDKWEEDVYVVVNQPNTDIPVFTVRKEDGTGRIRTLHRNHLLSIGSVTDKSDAVPTPKPRQKPPCPITKPRRRQPKKVEVPITSPDESDSDESSVYMVYTEESGGSIPHDATGQPDIQEITPMQPGDDHGPADGVHDLDQDGDAHDSQSEVEDDQSQGSNESDPVPEAVSSTDPAQDTSTTTVPRQDGTEVIYAETVADHDTSVEVQPEAAHITMDQEAARENQEAEPPPQPPQPSVRKSMRNRKPPSWFTSGNYAMYQQPTPTPEWLQKVDVFKGLVTDGTIDISSQKLCEVMVSLMMTK